MLEIPHPHDTRLRAAAERRWQELMENLSGKGKAIFMTVTAANYRAHEKLKAELCELIAVISGGAWQATKMGPVDQLLTTCKS
jgi:hypothetical protein